MYEEPSSPVEIDSLIPFIRVFTSNFLYLTKLLFQKLTPWPILTIQFCITTKKKKKIQFCKTHQIISSIKIF